MNRIPRNEHPRPDFERENWLCLNGEWDFSYDQPVFDKKIIVPYACETELSGINDKGFHPVVFYRRSFTLPEDMKGKRIFLRFGAVDYESEVFVNGQAVARHTGGQTPFGCDITGALTDGENEITLRAFDDPFDMEMPRGKQLGEKIAQYFLLPHHRHLAERVAGGGGRYASCFLPRDPSARRA